MVGWKMSQQRVVLGERERGISFPRKQVGVFLGSRWASSWRKGCRPSVYSVCLFPGVSRVRGGSVMFCGVWGRAGDRGGLDVQFLPLSWSLQPEGLPMPRGTRRQDTGHGLVCVQDQSKPLCKHLSTPTPPPSQGPERARIQTLQPRERVFGSSLKWGRYQRLRGSKGGSERGDQLGRRWGGGHWGTRS